MTNELEMERFKDDLELDISFAIGDLLRFRVNVYRDRMGVCAALRTIPTEIKTAQELGIDPRIADLALLPRGLVLVCGPTGRNRGQGECGTRRPYHHHRRPDRIRASA